MSVHNTIGLPASRAPPPYELGLMTLDSPRTRVVSGSSATEVQVPFNFSKSSWYLTCNRVYTTSTRSSSRFYSLLQTASFSLMNKSYWNQVDRLQPLSSASE